MEISLSDFVFDFNDLGLIEAELVVSVLELSKGKLDIRVREVHIFDERIKVSKDLLLEICNNQTGAVYADIECNVANKWPDLMLEAGA